MLADAGQRLIFPVPASAPVAIGYLPETFFSLSMPESIRAVTKRTRGGPSSSMVNGLVSIGMKNAPEPWFRGRLAW